MSDHSEWAPAFTPGEIAGLRTIGVTGTNGKTSTTWMIARALLVDDPALVWVCTLGSFVGTTAVRTPSTYEGFVQAVATGRRQGGTLAVLELTSQALAGGFASHWPIQLGVFTNLSHDHLDLHPSMEHYLASKAQLFVHLPPGGTAVLNRTDPASEHLQRVLPPGVRVLRYGGRPGNDDALSLASIQEHEDHTELFAVLPGGRPLRLRTRFVGRPFADDALAALGALLAWGLDPEEAAQRLAAIDPPPGRFQWIGRQPGVVIDYAHSPSALEQVVAVARRLCRGRLTVVFGAGGGRDRTKRPAMGAAVQAADRIILTSDNPRDEDPGAIANEVARGIQGGRVVIELDRRTAIHHAILSARDEDLVLVAGKGHEEFQLVEGRSRPFSDANVAREALIRRRGPTRQRRNRT